MVFWLIPLAIGGVISAGAALWQSKVGEAQVAEARTLEEEMTAKRQSWLYQVQAERARIESALQQRAGGVPIWAWLVLGVVIVAVIVVLVVR
jgi:hypothetical protein